MTPSSLPPTDHGDLPLITQLIQDARSYLSDPAHWTSGCLARDARGDILGHLSLVTSSRAASHCLVGAIARSDEMRHHYFDFPYVGAPSGGTDDFLYVHIHRTASVLGPFLPLRYRDDIGAYNDYLHTLPDGHARLIDLLDRVLLSLAGELRESGGAGRDDRTQFVENSTPSPERMPVSV